MSTVLAQKPSEGPANEAEWVRIPNTGIYLRTSTGAYYERPRIDGVTTFRSLGKKILREALKVWKQREEVRARGGDPQPRKRATTVGECIRLYQSAGCPDRQRAERPETSKKAELKNCEILLRFWESIRVSDLTVAVCDAYHDYRAGTVKKGSGKRTTDLELNTLKNALYWACRRELLKHMPLPSGWPSYCSEKLVQHCRNFMPRDAEELHKVAKLLFEDPRSESLAWQFLFEGYIGIRSKEVVMLRADAEPEEPGWVTEDGGSLRVHRGKGQEMISPFAKVHDGLSETIKAWKAWKRNRYPTSPWYFPGRDGETPLSKGALAHALLRIRARIGRIIKPHGLRAFYVTMRRSHGIPDNQISYEIGHTSGGRTLVQVYGGAPPHWQEGGGPKWSWLPKENRAWDAIRKSSGMGKSPKGQPGKKTSRPKVEEAAKQTSA